MLLNHLSGLPKLDTKLPDGIISPFGLISPLRIISFAQIFLIKRSWFPISLSFVVGIILVFNLVKSTLASRPSIKLFGAKRFAIWFAFLISALLVLLERVFIERDMYILYWYTYFA